MKRIPIFLALALGFGTSFADEAIDGKALHTTNCVACHANMTGGDGSALYTRDDRRVTSYKGLEAQVRLCEANLGLKWFDDEVFSVVKHLDASYYHLENK